MTQEPHGCSLVCVCAKSTCPTVIESLPNLCQYHLFRYTSQRLVADSLHVGSACSGKKCVYQQCQAESLVSTEQHCVVRVSQCRIWPLALPEVSSCLRRLCGVYVAYVCPKILRSSDFRSTGVTSLSVMSHIRPWHDESTRSWPLRALGHR